MEMTAQHSRDKKFWDDMRAKLVGPEHNGRPLLFVALASEKDVFGNSDVAECIQCGAKVWVPLHSKILTVPPIIACRGCFERVKDEILGPPAASA